MFIKFKEGRDVQIYCFVKFEGVRDVQIMFCQV